MKLLLSRDSCTTIQYIMMMNPHVLVLNKSYQPVNVIGARRAFGMLFIGSAFALDSDYQQLDLPKWLDVEPRDSDDTIGSVSGPICVPRIIVLKRYSRFPTGHVRFCRGNIFLRDNHTCQYCGAVLPKMRLNLDHVMPRSRGGKHSWTNVVTSCIPCNTAKASMTPKEAGMPLLTIPRQPKWRGVLEASGFKARYREWLPFVVGAVRGP